MKIVKGQLYNMLKNWSTWIIMSIFLWVQIANIIDKENAKLSLIENNLIFFRIGNAELCAIIFSIIAMGKYIKNNYIKNIKALYTNKERIVLANTVVTVIYFAFLYVLSFIIDVVFIIFKKQTLGFKQSGGELLSYIAIISVIVLFTGMIQLMTKSQLVAFIVGYIAIMGKDIIFKYIKIENDALRNLLVSIVVFIILGIINRIIAKKVYSVA